VIPCDAAGGIDAMVAARSESEIACCNIPRTPKVNSSGQIRP
jgi:hypothetical protein